MDFVIAIDRRGTSSLIARTKGDAPYVKVDLLSASRSRGRRRTRENCSTAVVLTVNIENGSMRENPVVDRVMLPLTQIII